VISRTLQPRHEPEVSAGAARCHHQTPPAMTITTTITEETAETAETAEAVQSGKSLTFRITPSRLRFFTLKLNIRPRCSPESFR